MQLRDIRTLYHASPERSGVSITTIDRSMNSVIELHGDKIGSCRDVYDFIRSAAFTKVYETLLAQIYKNIPDIADLDFNTVSSKYGKAVILKYITNKKTFQPNHNVLDDPAERNVMRELLIEMESILFSDSKVKILAIDATGNAELDKAKLEGINIILKNSSARFFFTSTFLLKRKVWNQAEAKLSDMQVKYLKKLLESK